MSQTNDLYEYGIQTENSDIRAHVSVVNQEIYVYQTKDGLAAIEKYNPRCVLATQGGVDTPTGKGYLVEPGWIEGLLIAKWPAFDWGVFHNNMNTSEKGKAAEKCVEEFANAGWFPIQMNINKNDDRNSQIGGTDLILSCNKKIQVKCDWDCGEKPKGTGNLFLQIAERNPFKHI